MKYVTKVLDAVYIIIRYLIAIILGMAIVLTFTEVIRRYFWGKSFIWSEEFLRYLFVYVGFIGGAAAFREKALSSFDLISKKIKSKRNKAILDIIINTAIIALVAFLGVKVLRLLCFQVLQTAFSRSWSINEICLHCNSDWLF